jgi:ligand-binding sensor domain-containing protein
MAMAFAIILMVFSNKIHAAPQIKILQSPLSSKIEQPTITAVFRDRNGFLWIGTQHGLYKFDGAKMSKFSSDLAGKMWIPASYIMQISDDSKGRIIVATFGGGLLVWNFLTESFQMLHESDSAELTFVTELAITGNDVALAGTKAGLFLQNLSYPSPTYSLPKKLIDLVNNSEISSIASDFAGYLYIASGLDIYNVSKNLDSFISVNWIGGADDEHDEITSLALSSNGRIFIGTDRGLLISHDIP